MRKYFAAHDKKKLKEHKDKISSLGRALLAKCDRLDMNIVRMLKAGKPYINKFGRRQFATTDEILAEIKKLEGFGVLERR